MTLWVKTSKKAAAKMVVGANPDSGDLLLFDGSTVPANTTIRDRATELWYEDLKNGVGKFLAFLDTHPVRLWKGETGADRRFYCDIGGIVRSGANPVLLLLESCAACTAQFDGFCENASVVVDVMNLLDEMVVYGHLTDLEIHYGQTAFWDKGIGVRMAQDKNALLATFRVFFMANTIFHH